ncbi:MAG: hypothetical protein ABIJ33_01890 [Patescibacteria group bacterium]|nr:hypothetical protein [Patescibacteria group bacterium]
MTSKIIAQRCPENPLLSPDPHSPWEGRAVYNASVVKDETGYSFVYRAESILQDYANQQLHLSTIGVAQSLDGQKITHRRQLIIPEKPWEKFGCEDPRVTKIENQYVILYTALSAYPPDAQSIKVAVALSSDLKTIKEKHLVTPFNAKAAVLFPEKIGGQYIVIMTVDTDQPPAKIALARLDNLAQLWDQKFWYRWYHQIEKHQLKITRFNTDQIEVGAAPVKTKNGWVLVYAHIQNYNQPDHKIFGIEAVLLDIKDPQKIVGRTEQPFLTPDLEYEQRGVVPNVIFPSGAIATEDALMVYYGAADTTVCLARLKLNPFLSYMKQTPYRDILKLVRYHKNPVLEPVKTEAWRAQAVFNSAAIFEAGQVHLLYRAMSLDNTSTIGWAASQNGFDFPEESHEPVYVPRIDHELKKSANLFSGCEDPRVTKLGDRFYMFYTAYDGWRPPQVALTSIKVEDFLAKNWIWTEPILISDPEIDNKNACLFPEKINGKYVILHRVAGQEIAIDLLDDLKFKKQTWLEKEGSISPRPGFWDSAKIGIAGPPLKTSKGWLLIYHGVSDRDKNYRLGYVILDLADPFKILYRSPFPMLEPVKEYEKIGIVNNVVFSCGAVEKDGQLFVYYGGADKVIGVATASMDEVVGVI